MKIKNKGKIHPSPSSSSSSSSSSSTSPSPPSLPSDKERDALSALKLLPAAIFALAAILSLEDREVLAYMITRSNKTANPSSIVQDSKKKYKKPLPNNPRCNAKHEPLFDCDCFGCYTSFWCRWDSSPNGQLIHQVIDAYEDYLSNREQSKRNAKGRKKDKSGGRVADKQVVEAGHSGAPGNISPEICNSSVELPEKASVETTDEVVENGEETEDYAAERSKGDSPVVASIRNAPVNNHRGLARKVLPDVLSLLNSRLWSLWNPNAQ